MKQIFQIMILLLVCTVISNAQNQTYNNVAVNAPMGFISQGATCSGSGCFSCSGGASNGVQYGLKDGGNATVWPASQSGGATAFLSKTFFSTGTFTVEHRTRTFSQPGGCSYSFGGDNAYGTYTFNVVEDLVWVGGAIQSTICYGSSINLYPFVNKSSGVTFLVDGTPIAGSSFDASSYSAGVHQISASYNFANKSTTLSNQAITVNNLVSVTGNPADKSSCPNGTVSISATGTGSGLTWKWQESTDGGGSWHDLSNAGVYSGVTTGNLQIAGMGSGFSGYKYRAALIGTCNTVTTTVATLTIYGQVSILSSPPLDIYKCSGDGLGLTASATPRNGAISYLWQYKLGAGAWTDWIGGATNDLGAIPGWDGMFIRYRAQDACGSVTENYSAAGTIHIYPPAVTSNPSDRSVCAGSNATFTVVPGGTGPFTYQWYEDGTPLTNNAVYNNVLTATLTVVGPSVAFSGKSYSCKVTGLCNNITSAGGVLTVANPPSISSNPSGGNVCQGGSTSFTVAATGSSLQYQWSYASFIGGSYVDIGGATSATYSIGSVTTGSGGYYKVRVFNSICTTPVESIPVNLLVQPITASTNPANASTCPGGNATFSVSGTGSGTITYQWYRAEASTPTNFVAMGGQTANQISLNNVSSFFDHGSVYRVVVHGNCGADITTTAAVLTVNAIPAAPSAADVARCGVGSISATATSPASSPVFKWYTNSADVVPIFTGPTYTISNLTTTTTYYVSVTSSCESPKKPVVFTYNPTQLVAMGTALNLCVAQSPYNLENDIVDIAAKGNNFTWTANSTSYNSKIFNPNVGAGTYIVTYVPPAGVQTSPKCYQTTTRTVNVIVGGGDGGIIFSQDGGTTSFVSLNSCVGNDPIILSSLPSVTGGTWTTVQGSGISTSGTTVTFTPDQNSFTAVNPNIFRYSVITGGCSATKDLSIYVKDNSSVPVVTGVPSVVCPGAPFTMSVSVSQTGTFTYEWYHAGQSTAFATGATLPFTPTKTETLNVRSINTTFGCKSAATIVTVTTPFSEGTITPSKSVLDAGDKVKFTYDVSTAGNSYEWKFGDGGIGSTEKDPTHYYYAPGDYTVTLKINSTLGCSSIVTYNTIKVNGQPFSVITGDLKPVTKDPLVSDFKAIGYPNPISNDYTIDSEVEIKAVAFTDMIGKTVLQIDGENRKRVTADLSGIPSGLYIVVLDFGVVKRAFKVVKR